MKASALLSRQRDPDSIIAEETNQIEARQKADSTNHIRLTTSIKEGMGASWPICVGYFPLGFAFGVLAQKAGFDMLDIALMSVLVYAGSSQFIAVAMLSSGAAPASIVLTTFMVNLRHVLMGSSLAVYLHSASRRFLSVFA